MSFNDRSRHHGGHGGYYGDRGGRGGGHQPPRRDNDGGHHQRGRSDVRGFQQGGGSRGGDRNDRSRSRGPPQRGGRGNPHEERLARIRWEEQGLDVQANFFKLSFQVSGVQTWYQYQIQMNKYSRKAIRDNDGNVVKDESGNTVYEEPVIGKPLFYDEDLSEEGTEEEKRQQARKNGSTHISRRVLRALQTEHNLEFVSDGTSMAFSATQLEGFTTQVDDRRRREVNRPEAGVYGPADTRGGLPSTNQQPVIKPWRVFPPVRVLRHCDDDEDYQGPRSSKYVWFQVKMTEVGAVSFNVNNGKIEGLADNQEQAPCQAINLAVHNAVLWHMLALRKGPFFFKEDIYRRDVAFDPLSMPVYGLLQNAKLTQDGFCQLVADLGLGWKKPEFGRNGDPIPLLEPRLHSFGGRLAGIWIENLSEPIPENQRQEVHQSLQKVTFHIRYRCGERWINEMMQKSIRGVDDNDLRGKEKKVRGWAKKKLPNRRLMKLSNTVPLETNIVWAADDPNLFSFEFEFRNAQGEREESRNITVAEYFATRYDIRLKYPKMPLVRISKEEYFPVEFLFQTQGPARNEANPERVTQFALKFNDDFACQDRMTEIKRLLSGSSIADPLKQKLQLLNLNLDTSPLELRAKVLKVPMLRYGRERNRANELGRKVEISNGSWSMQGAAFQRPATLHSFAVVNLAGARFRPNLPNDLFAALNRHGIERPFLGSAVNPSPFWDQLMVSMDPERPIGEWKRCFEEARSRARDTFLHGALRRGVCFRTMALIDRGEEGRKSMEVMVLPHSLVSTNPAHMHDQGQYVVMDYTRFKTNQPSHFLTLNDGTIVNASFLYRIQGQLFLLSEVRFNGTSVEIFTRGQWQSVAANVEHVFVDQNRNPIQNIQYHEIQMTVTVHGEDRTVGHLVDENLIECPSILFVILPKKADSTRMYHTSKWMSYIGTQVNSQTLNMESYDRQRNSMQYCSNVALKINSKLASSLDCACAWSWEEQYEDGTSDIARKWLGEVHTLIIGLTKAAGQGQSSKMVVVGTGYLSVGGQTCCFEGRYQSKSPIIDRSVVRDIAKNLTVQFHRFNGALPERIVVIRCGEHDGHFKDILEKEIKGIREGCEAVPTCRPLITCLVAQGGGGGRHNIRLVPTDRSVELIRNNKNVPSGTCVDSDKLLVPTNDAVKQHENQLRKGGVREGLQLYGSTSKVSNDFFLVSQGGLKGTSNGVFYRVILNENGIFHSAKATPLTGDVLQRLVYSLSFIYGKATKAPRDSALMRSADLLANTLLGMISAMTVEDQEQLFPKHADPTLDGANIYGGSLLPSFGPFAANHIDVEDPFRPHVLA